MPEPDLTNLRWFFDHLALRDHDASAFAVQLVHREDGWRVRSFIGPVQMDVWALVVGRGDWTVAFGVERGFSDGIVAKNERRGERLRLESLSTARAWLESLGA